VTRTAKTWLYEYDVPYFFREATGLVPDRFQVDFLTTDAQDVLLCWCRQGSKTTVAVVREAHGALFNPDSLGLVISATQRQSVILQRRIVSAIRRVTRQERRWRRIKSVEVPEDPFNENSQLIRCNVLSLELSNGSEVVSLPPHPDTIRGYSPNRITIDEAARVSDSCYESSIRPMRAAHPCRLTVMSTPKSTFGFFYEEVYGKGKTDPVWWRSTMTADECVRISPEFLARERMKMVSEAAFLCEYYLQPMPRAGAIFSRDMIDRMFVKDPDTEALREEWEREAGLSTDETEEFTIERALAKSREWR
jgi:hypothetical protein